MYPLYDIAVQKTRLHCKESWLLEGQGVFSFALFSPTNLVLFPQHHCRACGRIFCNDCTKRRMALTHLGYYQPVRVCDECYSKLHGAQNTKETDVCVDYGCYGSECNFHFLQDGFILVSQSSQ